MLGTKNMSTNHLNMNIDAKINIGTQSRYPPDHIEHNMLKNTILDGSMVSYIYNVKDIKDVPNDYKSDLLEHDMISIAVPSEVHASNSAQLVHNMLNANNGDKPPPSGIGFTGGTREPLEEKEDDYDILYNSLQHLTCEDGIICNNLLYTVSQMGFGKEYISGASGFPPELDLNNQYCTLYDPLNANVQYIDIDTDEGHYIDHIIGDTTVDLIDFHNQSNNICKITATSDIVLTDNIYDPNTHSINNINDKGERAREIEHNLVKWYLTVPVRTKQGEILQVKMLADTGANAGCMRTSFAKKYFKDCILPNQKHATLNVPGGTIHPKFCCYMIIPAKSGIPFRAKFYLIDKLAVDVICDLNMLIAFGYDFSKPPRNIIQHKEEPEPDLHINERFDYKIHSSVEDKSSCLALTTLDNLENNSLTYQSYAKQKIQKYNYVDCDSETVINNIYSVEMATEINGQSNIVNKTIDEIISSYDTQQQCTHACTNEDSSSENNLSIMDQHLMEQSILDRKSTEKLSVKPLDTPSVSMAVTHSVFNFEENMEHVRQLNSYNTAVFDYTDEYDRKERNSKEYKTLVNNINAYNEQQRCYSYPYIKCTHLHTHCLRRDITDPTAVTRTSKYIPHNYNPFSVKSIMQTRQLGKLSYFKYDNFNFNKLSKPLFVHFINMKQSFMATEEEIKKSKELNSNKFLTWNDFTYLKNYEKLYGERFKDLYIKTMNTLKEYSDIMAKYTYSRRTMKVQPARLGIKPEYRDRVCYASQYSLSAQQRLWVIDYTLKNEENGYWHKVSSTMHCMPIVMVPKKNQQGVIIRYRPAFDARIVNQYCELIPPKMPTLKDFDDIYMIKGLMTLADIKNMYDCIPLDPRDQPWATVMTPCGLYRMTHVAYGFKNAPSIAQRIMNMMAIHVGLVLVYIDDILLKHPWHWGTPQLISHLRRFFDYIRSKNMLLNPSKLWVFIDKCASFGFQRTLEGSSISDIYKNKILSLPKPNTVKEMKNFIGIVVYVGRYLYNYAKLMYWLKAIELECERRKGTKLTWTKMANTAYEQIKYLVENAPLLHNPTNEGLFCIKCDACDYGTGAVLYQRQMIRNQLKWVIIDMFSKMTPQSLRHAHSMFHEARVIVQACHQWHYHLLKRKFVVVTDNYPISEIFKEKFRELSQTTQKQLLRLRLAIQQFTYDVRHVSGLDNELADGLSRFTAKLILKDSNKYLDMAQMEKPTDMNNPKMKTQDINILNNIDIASKEGEFWKDPTQALFNCLYTQNNIASIHHLSNFGSNYDSFNWITQQQNAIYNSTLKQFRINAIKGESEHIQNFVNSTDISNVLSSNEYSFNTPAYNQFLDEIKDVSMIVKDISPLIQEKLISYTNDTIKELQLYNQIMFNDDDTDELDYNSDESDISVFTPDTDVHVGKPTMRTRAHANKSKQIRNKFGNSTYDQIHSHMKTRSELLFDLFGYRGMDNIFDEDYILSYQNADNAIKLVRKIMKKIKTHGYDTDDINIRPYLDKLLIEDQYYYLEIILDNFRINEKNLLQCKIWNQFDEEYHYVHVIPFTLRGKYMDYYHHN